jgi:CheY-like chemotaxis protein
MSFIQINMQEMKVLVVDDSSTARKILTELLHGIGIAHIAGAADGAEAIERLRTFPADIMVCDLHMVPLDGIELTRLIRNASDSPNLYLPIIMLTSDATQAQIKNAMNAGVNAFMSKPVKMKDLHRKMFSIFSRPLVYIREGRTMRPVIASQSCEPAVEPQQPAKVKPPQADNPPAQPEEAGDEPIDPDQRLLTRTDMGLT